MSANLNWETVARKREHPIAVAILDHLSKEGGACSPKELSDLFKEPLGNVSYHVKTLLDSGLLELARTEQRRGALAHFYVLSPEATK